MFQIFTFNNILVYTYTEVINFANNSLHITFTFQIIHINELYHKKYSTIRIFISMHINTTINGIICNRNKAIDTLWY